MNFRKAVGIIFFAGFVGGMIAFIGNLPWWAAMIIGGSIGWLFAEWLK